MTKKKIGIITYHFARNYGAVLQCYALQRYIQKIGQDANVINAISLNQEKNNSLFHKKNGLKNVLVNICLFPFIIQRKRKEKLFDRFVQDYISCTKRIYNRKQLESYVNDEKIEVIFSGSDQVWNPHIADFDDMFFLPINTNALKIGYSVSIGESTYDDIKEFSEYAKDFYKVGLREKSAKLVVEKLCSQQIFNTVDPVLLLNKIEWEKFIKQNSNDKKYLLCYLIDKGPIKQNMSIAKEIAQKFDLEIKYIWMHLGIPSFNRKFINDAGPVEFLNYIYNSSVVMTDGYHGTVFATIFNKEIYAIINNKNSSDTRIKDYLHSLGLDRRIIYGESPNITYDKIDYSIINKLIEKLPEDSRSFLDDVLE